MVRKTFASSVVKIDAKGNRVISDYVDEDAGERLEADVRADESIKNDAETEAHATGEEAPAGFENDAERLAAEGEPSGNADADTTDNSQVPATDPEEEGADASESASAERPKDSDDKDTWFAYAQSKGFEGGRDDLTEAQFIEQYG